MTKNTMTKKGKHFELFQLESEKTCDYVCKCQIHSLLKKKTTTHKRHLKKKLKIQGIRCSILDHLPHTQYQQRHQVCPNKLNCSSSSFVFIIIHNQKCTPFILYSLVHL